MVQFRRSPEARPLDKEWHRNRQRAREQAFNSDLDFFSDQERIEFELDTAQIDGSDNPLTYTIDRPINLLGMNGTDIRTLEDR